MQILKNSVMKLLNSNMQNYSEMIEIYIYMFFIFYGPMMEIITM